jgi:plasmid stability protein
MNQVVIRNLDDAILQRLKQVAWQAGRLPDDMARHLLIEAVRSDAVRHQADELLEEASRVRRMSRAIIGEEREPS